MIELTDAEGRFVTRILCEYFAIFLHMTDEESDAFKSILTKCSKCLTAEDSACLTLPQNYVLIPPSPDAES